MRVLRLLGVLVTMVGFGTTACQVRVDASDDASSPGTVRQAMRTAPAETFGYALCVCGDLDHVGTLTTEACEGQSANVEARGRVNLTSGTRIRGSLVSGGDVDLVGSVGVRDDLVTRSDLSGVGELEVGRNLTVGGTLSTVGSLVVGAGLAVAKGDDHVGPVRVGQRAPYSAPHSSPCGCDAFDVAGAVALARETNDNDSMEVPRDPTAVGATELRLRSGRYYFSDPAFVGHVRVHVEGRVSIYVDGSIDTVGASTFALGAGAALDMYVAGSIRAVGSIVTGRATDPSAFRLYVGGRDAIVAGVGESELTGFIFAPDAEVDLVGNTRVLGAITARSVSHVGDLHVFYVPATPRPDAGERVTAVPEVAASGALPPALP